MDLKHALQLVIEPGLLHLPDRMDSPEARAMLLAIGLQESSWRHRSQVGGPARGFWQFERVGVEGVLTHEASRLEAKKISIRLEYDPDSTEVYRAIKDNDALACVFARLLLWRLPRRLPKKGETDEAWGQYLEAWGPGKPRPDHWPDHFKRAWQIVEEA